MSGKIIEVRVVGSVKVGKTNVAQEIYRVLKSIDGLDVEYHDRDTEKGRSYMVRATVFEQMIEKGTKIIVKEGED